jgi:glycosyltransferase involved in cell wall biosynthesis
MDVALIVIGRNEGVRLRRCLGSVTSQLNVVVYVDSGSTDGSTEWAADQGAQVVDLDLSMPFTAARARNAGAARVFELASSVKYLQFIDGDCELAPEWLEQAKTYLELNPGVVAVCGRLRERYPDRSIYNQMCDIEWDTPVGPARHFGGIVMIRAIAFREAGGFRDDLIAGEEPELAIRLRNAGGLVCRIGFEMALHDADITRFSQWWRRSVRAGYAYALGASIHGAPPERHWVRESRRSWIWGFFVPTLGISGALAGSFKVSIAVLIIFVLQWLRLFINGRGDRRLRLASATFLIIGKFAEVMGQLRFLWHRFAKKKARLIEYK